MVFEPERQPTVGPSRSHWGRLEDAGLAPRRILLGPRRIAWRLSDLLGWIDERAAVVDTPEARRRRAPQVPSAGAPGERTTRRRRRDDDAGTALARTRRGTEVAP